MIRIIRENIRKFRFYQKKTLLLIKNKMNLLILHILKCLNWCKMTKILKNSRKWTKIRLTKTILWCYMINTGMQQIGV